MLANRANDAKAMPGRLDADVGEILFRNISQFVVEFQPFGQQQLRVLVRWKRRVVCKTFKFNVNEKIDRPPFSPHLLLLHP